MYRAFAKTSILSVEPTPITEWFVAAPPVGGRV